jgi:hypothetical protein
MLDVELGIRDFDGSAVIALRGGLDLAAPQGPVRRVLEATGLTESGPRRI